MDAYALVQTEVGKATDATFEAAKIDGVATAETITGPYDVVLRMHGPDLAYLNGSVLARIQEIEGVTRALTCVVVPHERRELPYSLQAVGRVG